MASNLGTLTLDLVAKIGGFTGPMDKASRHSKKTSADIAKASKLMGAAIGASAVAAVAGIALIVNKQRELIDQQAKAAQMLDTTYTSMANLKRAGELGGVGMEKISAAGRQLNLNIGKAIQGADLQVEAFGRLGLSAQELYDLPLDQRISKINQALRDNVQSSERAAVAADIFGAKNAKAIQQLDPGTIAEAARQVEVFGLNLSDVDAAKVEMANDAMSTFGLLGDGIGKQLTVELAPALKAIGDLFLESAEEAGGMGNVVSDSVGKVINAMAFVMDAADGVKRAFEITADGIIYGIGKAVSFVTNNTAGLLSAISMLPGVDYSATVASLREFATEANGIANEAASNIDATLNKPMAGEKFKQFYADAKAAGQAAAEATVASREAAAKGGEAFVAAESAKTKAAKKTTDAIGSQIRALQFQAETVGMSADQVTLMKLQLEGASGAQLALADAALKTVAAYEAQAKAIEDAKKAQDDTNSEAMSIIDSLMSEEESILKSYERRRQIILDNTLVTGEAQNELLRKLEEKKNEDLLEINGSYWERYLLAAEEALTSFDELSGSVIENFSSQFGSAFEAMIFDAQTLEESMLGMAESMARSVINALGQMAAQWLAYQVVQMLVGKTTQASAATTIAANATAMSITAGINAFASAAAIPIVGWAAAPGAMAAALAVTGPMAAAAGVAALSGMAHDGIDSVPQTGTWLLEKGERVTTAGTSAKLDRTLSSIQAQQASAAPGKGPGGVTVNQTFNTTGRIDNRTSSQMATDAARNQRRAQSRFS